MSRLAASFVLGYHGCEKSVGLRAVNGDLALLQSTRDYDWLGPGAYFWENDPQRALEWAKWKKSRGDYKSPYVIGAVIDLRNCLDLLARENLEILHDSYGAFITVQRKSGLPIPMNKSVPGQPNADLILRYLDCAVIRHLHSVLDALPADKRAIEPFDTVRGMFTEGERLYKGSGIRRYSHVQIAVRNSDCIRGLFIPHPYPAP